MNEFSHQQHAHCESGALSVLLTHYGLSISEPMIFGITSSLSFVFLPVVKLNNMPLISYRDMPRNMVKKLPKILNMEMAQKRYDDPHAADRELTELLNAGKLVGLQTSVYYLPYFPKDMRFHFNAHNLVVCQKQDDNYLISDPVFEDLQWCDARGLTKARFAKGVFAPKGFLYYPKSIPEQIDFTPLIKKAIRKNAKKMLSPFPYAGVKGMQKLAKKIATFDKDSNPRYVINYLTHLVRMQEEIGTGGGGFRYLYAAFLNEAKHYAIDNDKLEQASQLLTQSGDTLRELALLCVQQCKHIDKLDGVEIAKRIQEVAGIEKEAFTLLKSI